MIGSPRGHRDQRLGSFFEIKYDMIEHWQKYHVQPLGSFFEIKYDMILRSRSFCACWLGSFFEIKYDMMVPGCTVMLFCVRVVL